MRPILACDRGPTESAPGAGPPKATVTTLRIADI